MMINSNSLKYYMLDSQTGMKLYAPDNISPEVAKKYNMQSEPAPAISRFTDEISQNPFENRGKSNFENRKGNPAFTQFRNMFELTPDPVEIAAKEVMQTDSKDVKTGVASVINEKVENNPKVADISDDSWEKMPAARSADNVNTESTPEQFVSNKNLPVREETPQITRVTAQEDETKSAAATIQGTGAAAKEAVSEVDTSIRPDFLKFERFYNNPGELTLNPSDETATKFVRYQNELDRRNYSDTAAENKQYTNINAPENRLQKELQPEQVIMRTGDFQDENQDGIDDRDQYRDQIPNLVDTSPIVAPINLNPPIEQNPILPKEHSISPEENINLRTGDFQDENRDGIDDRNQYRDQIPNLVDGVSATPTLTPEQTTEPASSSTPTTVAPSFGAGIPYFDSAKIQEFIAALNKAKEKGDKEFEWNGVKYQTGVTEPTQEQPPKEVTPESPDLTPTTGGTTPTTGTTTPTTGGTTPTTGGTDNRDDTGTAPPGSGVTEKPKPTFTSLSIGNLLSRVFTGKSAAEEPVTGNTATPAASTVTTQGLSGSITPTQSVTPQSTASAQLVPTSSNSVILQGTEGILKTQAENASMTSPVSVAQSQQPVIINNTTMIPQPPPTEKVKEVFSDENTFARISAMDVYHPSGFPGFRYG